MHYKTSWSYIRRSPFQALAAVSVLAVTFFVATIIAILGYASSRLITYFETRPQIVAFLNSDATTEEIGQLQQKLSVDGRVLEVSYVTKEEALEIYKKATADNPLLGELVSPSIFPASIEFSIADLNFAEAITEEVKNEPVVESVRFTASLGGQSSLKDVVNRLKKITTYTRIGGLVFVSVLGTTSFLVLLIVIGMRVVTRRQEIEILDLIGATSGFIRAPILFEAINYALLGVVIGWSLAIILILYSAPTIIAYFEPIPILPQEALSFFGLLIAILVAELLIGIFIAFFGSLFAISRAHKRK